jgi:plasmid stabilization system protein ParE
VVIWSAPSKADLRHIFEYIAHDSHHYARKVTQEIMNKTAILNELPHIGRAVPEVGDNSVRELSLYTYRIIYEISGKNVLILAVAHKRRGLQAAEIPRHL